jgi:hypothetical protein
MADIFGCPLFSPNWRMRVRHFLVSFALAAAGLTWAVPALPFVLKIGDTVYVDGKPYTLEEWKKMRDHPGVQERATPVASPAAAPAAKPSTPSGPRAATCTTPVYYDEFPKDGDEFQCSGGLGALTREQIIQSGWKIDFIEKLPPPAGQPASSPRGLPLSLYKLVISR